jgi:hypothetical protein
MVLADRNIAVPTMPIHAAVGTKKRQSLAKRAASIMALKCLLTATSPLEISFEFMLSVPSRKVLAGTRALSCALSQNVSFESKNLLHSAGIVNCEPLDRVCGLTVRVSACQRQASAEALAGFLTQVPTHCGAAALSSPLGTLAIRLVALIEHCSRCGSRRLATRSAAAAASVFFTDPRLTLMNVISMAGWLFEIAGSCHVIVSLLG